MATKRSTDMASNTADSIMEKEWMQNIWRRHASKVISEVPKRKIPSTVGRVEAETPTSANASMARKRYMGWCRDASVLMTWRMVPFPRKMMMYIRQKGMDIQMCSVSSPGMPVKMNVVGKNPTELLEFFMLKSHPVGQCHLKTEQKGSEIILCWGKISGHQQKRRRNQMLIHLTKDLLFGNWEMIPCWCSHCEGVSVSVIKKL